MFNKKNKIVKNLVTSAKKIGNKVEGFTGGKELVQKVIPGGSNPSWGEVGKDAVDVGLTVTGGLAAKTAAKMAAKAASKKMMKKNLIQNQDHSWKAWGEKLKETRAKRAEK